MARKYTQGITIDGTYFDVPLFTMEETANFLDKYAERTEDGALNRELIGVYYNHHLEFGLIDDPKIEDQLWDRLTAPQEFHEVKVPDRTGTLDYTCYITSVSRKARKIKEKDVEFESLACDFIAKRPARTP